MPRKVISKKAKLSKKIKFALLLIILLVIAITIIFFQKPTFKQNRDKDYSNYCVPLQGGSFSLENGKFKDYLNGYEFDLSEFPDAKTYDPICKRTYYNFELTKSSKNTSETKGEVFYSSGFVIFPEKDASPDADLFEFASSQINPEVGLTDVARENYKAKTIKGETSQGKPYIRIYEPAGTYNRAYYLYYLNIDGKIIHISFNPGLESQQVILNEFERVIKSFKINKDLIGQRKTILEK